MGYEEPEDIPSPRNLLASVFMYAKGILLTDYLEKVEVWSSHFPFTNEKHRKTESDVAIHKTFRTKLYTYVSVPSYSLNKGFNSAKDFHFSPIAIFKKIQVNIFP